jgi:hypothetical protein
MILTKCGIDRNVNGGHSNSVIPNFLQSEITAWRTSENDGGSHTIPTYFRSLKWCMIINLGKVCNFYSGRVLVDCKITAWQKWENFHYLWFDVDNEWTVGAKDVKSCSEIDHKCVVTYEGFVWRKIMGSGFDDWVYWHFFTITVDYNSIRIELLLNDVCLMILNVSRISN